jgi:hypothetical protein
VNPDTEQVGYHAQRVTKAQEAAAEALVRRCCGDDTELVLQRLGLAPWPTQPPPPPPPPGVEVCKNGHPRTEENTRYRMRDGYRCRECLDCHRAYQQGQRLTPQWNPDTHCRKGHPRTPDNSYTGSDGGRRCKECQTNADRARRRREREARNPQPQVETVTESLSNRDLASPTDPCCNKDGS